MPPLSVNAFYWSAFTFICFYVVNIFFYATAEMDNCNRDQPVIKTKDFVTDQFLEKCVDPWAMFWRSQSYWLTDQRANPLSSSPSEIKFTWLDGPGAPEPREFTKPSGRQETVGHWQESVTSALTRQQVPDQLGPDLLSYFLPFFFRCSLQDVFILQFFLGWSIAKFDGKSVPSAYLTCQSTWGLERGRDTGTSIFNLAGLWLHMGEL